MRLLEPCRCLAYNYLVSPSCKSAPRHFRKQLESLKVARRRSRAMRSERWDQPRGAGRQPPESHPAANTGAGAAPSMQRRASASASSPLGLEPQHAQPIVQQPASAPVHQPASRQLSSPVNPAAMQPTPSQRHEAAAKAASLPVPPLRLSSLGTGSRPGDGGRTSGAAPATQSSGTWGTVGREEKPPNPAGSMSAARPVAAAAKASHGKRPSSAAAHSPAAAAQGSALQQPADVANKQAEPCSTGAQSQSQSQRRASCEGAAPQRSPFEQTAQPAAPEDVARTDPAAAAPADTATDHRRRPAQRSVTMDPALERSGSLHAVERDQTVSQDVRHKPHVGTSSAPPARQSSGTQSWAAIVADDGSRETSAAPEARSTDPRQPARDSARAAQPTADANPGAEKGPPAAQAVPPLPGHGATGSGSGSGRSQQVAM